MLVNNTLVLFAVWEIVLRCLSHQRFGFGLGLTLGLTFGLTLGFPYIKFAMIHHFTLSAQ